jgi:tetratricopeptide (TPR) repeat protein
MSSCDAGSGGISFFVDEFAGLPAALQLAGVATVVSPLWPVGVEVAALFADLFYAALTASRGEVDVLALVQQTQQQLRRMDREQANTAIARLGEASTDRVAQLLLDAARRRILQSDELYPFEHPYDWAAFHVTGAPTVVVPFAGQLDAEPSVPGQASTSVAAAAADVAAVGPSAASQPTEPPESYVVPEDKTSGDGAEVAEASPRPGNVFELGEAADKLFELTGDEALKSLAAEFIYKRGLAYERAQEAVQAMADFARAVELDPSLLQAHIRLGQLYAARQDHEQALIHYEAAILQDPDNALALLSRALAYIKLKSTEAALVDLEQAIALESGDDIAYLAYKTRAEIYLDSELYDQAVADLTETLALRPEDALSYLRRAAAHRQLAERIADANRAMLFLPEAAVAYNLRGLALLDAEEYERAAADFDKAHGLDPGMMEPLYNRGLAYSHLEDYPRAIASFDAAIKLAPELPELYTDRGLAHAYLGEYERALADHNQALALDSNHIAALYNRACAYSLKHEVGSIVADLTAVLQRDPSLLDHARSDPDLKWARQTLPDVRTLWTCSHDSVHMWEEISPHLTKLYKAWKIKQ